VIPAFPRQRRRLDAASYLGCLLSEQLGLQLRPTGSTKRLTFVEGEDGLSGWMADNAYVT
jgi:hypothetical protein